MCSTYVRLFEIIHSDIKGGFPKVGRRWAEIKGVFHADNDDDDDDVKELDDTLK